MTKAPHTAVRVAAAAHNPRPALRHRGVTDDDPLRRLPSFNEQDVSDKPSTVQSIARLDREARQAQRGKSNDRRGTLLAVDDLVQRVVRALRESGQLRDTLVIFTSDNGYLLGEHRLRGKNQVYDTATRVPLMMRGPGVPAGMKVVRRSQIWTCPRRSTTSRTPSRWSNRTASRSMARSISRGLR